MTLAAMGAIRCGPDGQWFAIDDHAHHPQGIARVETRSDRVRVHFTQPLAFVHGCAVAVDETYAKAHIVAGASVGLPHVDVLLVGSGSGYLNPAQQYREGANVWVTVWGEPGV